MLCPCVGVCVLLTKDTQLLARVLSAPWAAEAFEPPLPPVPKIVLIGGMRAALFCLKRSGARWGSLSGGGGGEVLKYPAHAALRGVEAAQAALLGGGKASKQRRRKLNCKAYELLSSEEYRAEAAAIAAAGGGEADE